MTGLRKILALLVLTCLGATSFAQIKGIGHPFIVNHPRSSYNASTQNWSVAQDNRGFMYFGNNDGILEYDGTSWSIYPVPNNSVVRSVLAIGDTIYAGAFEQIGFLAPNDTGQLAWNSLNHLIPPQYANFDEVWNIFAHNGSIIFQSFSFIFILKDGQISVVVPDSELSFMHQSGEKFFIVEREKGLMLFQDDSLSLISNHPAFFRNEITCVLPLDHNTIILGTSNEGLFLWDGKELKPWEVMVNPLLKRHNLFSGITLPGGNFAFGSISNGVFITDQQGNVLQHLNRIKGLQNNTVLALFQDRRNNLWLGLDNGIDFIEISSPLTMLNHNFNIESAYASIVHNGIVYVGTNQGLFATSQSTLANNAGATDGFQLISGTEGQVWSLQVHHNTLFCGHNYGAFIIDGLSATQISDIRGFWSFLAPPLNPDLIIAGTYTGLVLLEKKQEQWQFLTEVEGFRESSRDLFLDPYNNLWISHGYRGLFKLHFQGDDFSQVKDFYLYRNQAGLPPDLPYNLQQVNGKMYVSTRNGILTYNYSTEEFLPDNDLNTLFQGKGFIDKMYQDNFSNIWYFTDNYIGVMRLLEDGTMRDITAPFSRINEFLLPAFQNISVAGSTNVFIGSQNGLVHYNATIINDYNLAEQVWFKEIIFYGRQQGMSFSLYNPQITKPAGKIPQLPFALNSVSFRFTSPVYENPYALRFSYRLKGFDQDWSEWDALNFKEYTNLREGDYAFEVKALNAFGIESPVVTFQFSVSPPFLRSRIAFAIYSVLLILIIAGNFFFVRKRMLKIRQREKIRHEKRLAQREKIFNEQSALSVKEIMHLRNESLQNEMRFKNKELANATLHLIQKNRTLTNLKTDLSKLLKSVPSDSGEKQLVNTLLKKVNKDLRNEKNWELFNNYFDEVHQDFINRLKEEYYDLSPKELRLCAYLRMNISSKEIAPLMNISVRGVEISRYRLRKKLKLAHNTNLTEFIMTF